VTLPLNLGVATAATLPMQTTSIVSVSVPVPVPGRLDGDAHGKRVRVRMQCVTHHLLNLVVVSETVHNVTRTMLMFVIGTPGRDVSGGWERTAVHPPSSVEMKGSVHAVL